MKSELFLPNFRLAILLPLMLAGLTPNCNFAAEALPDQAVVLPFRGSITPIATDLWLNRYRVEVSLAEFGNSVEEIAGYFDHGVDPPVFGSASLPALVRWFEGGVLISWWQASKLVSLQLRPVTANSLSIASSGLLMVRHDEANATSGLSSRTGPCAQSMRLLPEQAIMLRTVGSKEGELVACFGLARIDQSPLLAAQGITEHLQRIGYRSTGLPRVLGERYQIHSFQNERAQLSVAIHARADETLLIIQTVSTVSARRFAPFARR